MQEARVEERDCRHVDLVLSHVEFKILQRLFLHRAISAKSEPISSLSSVIIVIDGMIEGYIWLGGAGVCRQWWNSDGAVRHGGAPLPRGFFAVVVW